jgi:hypothetical protein
MTDSDDRNPTEPEEPQLEAPEADEIEQAAELIRKEPPKRGEADPAAAADEILEIEAEETDLEDELSGDDYVD